MPGKSHEDISMSDQEKYWQEDGIKLDAIQRAGGFTRFCEKNKSKIKKAFCENPSCVCCMDERVVSQMTDAMYIAGSGILIKDDPVKKAKFVEELKKQGIKDTYTHARCGAVDIYAERKGISKEQAIKEGEEWARELAGLLGGKYLGEKKVVPEESHVARVVYIDMTGKFNPGAVEVLPGGFVISGTLGIQHAIEQLEVALTIAFGDHGYAERLNQTTPFEIVVVGSTGEEHATGDLITTLANIKSRFGGRVRTHDLIWNG